MIRVLVDGYHFYFKRAPNLKEFEFPIHSLGQSFQLVHTVNENKRELSHHFPWLFSSEPGFLYSWALERLNFLYDKIITCKVAAMPQNGSLKGSNSIQDAVFVYC